MRRTCQLNWSWLSRYPPAFRKPCCRRITESVAAWRAPRPGEWTGTLARLFRLTAAPTQPQGWLEGQERLLLRRAGLRRTLGGLLIRLVRFARQIDRAGIVAA